MSELRLVKDCQLFGKTLICNARCITVGDRQYCEVTDVPWYDSGVAWCLIVIAAVMIVCAIGVAYYGIKDSGIFGR